MKADNSEPVADTAAAAISARLSEYLANEILGTGNAIAVEENLLGDGLVDSLGMLRLVGYIESTYQIKIAPEQFTIQNFRNLDVISRYVEILVDSAKK